MLRIPAPPAEKRDGIGQVVADALGVDVHDVTLEDDTLVIDAPDAAKSKAEAAVNAHTPPAEPTPVPPLSDAEITALRALITV